MSTLDENMNVPVISNELVEYLLEEFSADTQIARGLLSDDSVVRSEQFLLGFLAGLGYARQFVDVMRKNQDGKFSDEEEQGGW